MPTENLIRLTYWGGWITAGVAMVYRLLAVMRLVDNVLETTRVLPHHLWQLSFLLFLISIATVSMARAKAA